MTTHHTTNYLPGFTPPPLTPQPGHPLADQTLVITGKIPGLTRAQAKLLIKQYGGAVSDTVRPGCYLVWDTHKRGQKLEQAQQKGIVIVPSNLLADLLRYPESAAPLPTTTDPNLLRLVQQTPGPAERPPQGNIDEFLSRALS